MAEHAQPVRLADADRARAPSGATRAQTVGHVRSALAGSAAREAPGAASLRQLRALADSSPRAVQLRTLQALADSRSTGVLQLFTLGGRVVQEDAAYPNANQAAILAHMGGEWAGANAGAVGGGHLLSAMTTAWGDAVYNSTPRPQDDPADGVHFQQADAVTDKISSHEYTFRLVAHDNGQARVSAAKASTFWPSGWTGDQLTQTLNASFRCGGAAEWASKANTTYWYRWQTLGANTAFPIERVAEPEGTDRQKMREGRA